MTAMIEVSFGELVDKITILEIKSTRITDPAKLTNVRNELTALSEVWDCIQRDKPSADLRDARAALKSVNEQLWNIEDAIRAHESAKNFDATFIELARNVYITNDRRAKLKKHIDTVLGSRFSEEKSYQSY